MRALRSRTVSSASSETDKDQNINRNNDSITKRNKKSKRKTKLTTKRESSSIKHDTLNKFEESVVFINETLKYSMEKQDTRETLLPPTFFNAVTSTAVKPSRTKSEDTIQEIKNISNKRKKLRKQKKVEATSESDENSFVSARNSVRSSESDSTIINDKIESINSPNSNNKIGTVSGSVLIVDISNTSIKSGSLQETTFNKNDSSGILVNHTFTKEKSGEYDAHFFGNSGEWLVKSLGAQDSEINMTFGNEGKIASENKENTQSNVSAKTANKFSIIGGTSDKTPIPLIKITEISPAIIKNKHNERVNKSLNILTKNKEKSIIKTPVRKEVKISPKIKSIRKKWESGRNDSLLMLEQIASTKKKDRKSFHKNKSPLNKSKANSITKSVKRTAMPNFALIHQKANEKMESLLEYSNRKKERAKKLMSGTKQSEVASTSKIVSGKSSRKLFEPVTTSTVAKKENFKRFGFKEPTPTILKKPVPIPTKAPISERSEIREIANKNRVQSVSSRDNSRVVLKGVRTNRRFELLMKMRQQ